jgi:hypothetical protein
MKVARTAGAPDSKAFIVPAVVCNDEGPAMPPVRLD